MKKAKIIIAIILGVLLLVGGFLIGISASDSSKEKRGKITVQQGIEEKISKIGELASVEDFYTNSALQTDSKKIKDWDIPLTKKSFIVKYNGIIKAGVDVSKIKISVEENIIHIKLPEAQILSHEIDEKSLEVLDETKNIFNPITIDDYNNFQIEQKELVEEHAIENGLLEKATENVKETIKLLITSINGIEKYEVVFS
ncbi:MAG: DUF4230 domain-containing protein [Clostridia bacterium]|nr:DUF4230 domain-containing protein [Clostridia bacterium]